MTETQITSPPGPEIAVIIPHLNQPDLLHILLTSLADQDFDMQKVEVVVVDNGSRDLPRDVVADFPFARLEAEAEPGPGPARNRGVALSSAPILAFTDADCRTTPNWLSTLHKHVIATNAPIGGQVRLTVETPGAPSQAEAFECVYAFDQPRYIHSHGYSVTANLAMPRSVFEAVGPFAGLETSEDLDWGRRAGAMGHGTRYVPDMVIYHPARRDMAALYAKWDRHIAHHFSFRAQGLSGKIRWALTTIAMAISPIAGIPRILRARQLHSPYERYQAFIGLCRIRFYRAQAMAKALLNPSTRTGNSAWNRD